MDTWGRWNRESIVTLKARFETNLRQNGDCIEWIGAIRKDRRYGICRAMGKFWLAHRLAYTLYKNEIPVGMCVCHTCDNGLCVNISHLFLGSQHDNIMDMERKGRSIHKRHESHGRAKLTKTKVLEIRSLARLGKSQRFLAKKFSVSRSNIRSIMSNKTWIL